MIEQDIKLLERLSFLEGARPEVTRRLGEAATVKIFQPGQVLLQEGDSGREVILVLEGKVEVVKGQGKDEILLARRGKGEVFGEMGFLEDRPRFATIRALEPTRILELSENTMRTVLAEQPDLLFRTTQILSSRLREAQMKMIVDLELKNQVLARAYRELKEAQAALVVKERMEHELELARKLQSSILPHHFPSLPGISFAARSKPARQVGGDFYDVIPLKDKRVGLVMADVSDKGMPAAIFMALSRSLIRAEARRSSSPKKVLLQTHKLLLEISQAGNSSSPMFVTIVYGVLDTVQGTFNYARAGHDFPLVYRRSERKCQTLKASGRVLGLTRQVALEEVQIDLHSGDMLVLYTDGIVDTNSPAGEFYGSERLRQAVCESKASTAQELCDFIFREIEDFQVQTEQYDDMALLITSIHAVD